MVFWKKPPMELPSCKQLPQQGTKTADVKDLDTQYKSEKEAVVESRKCNEVKREPRS